MDGESTQLNIFEQQGSKAFLIGFFPFLSHDSSQGSEGCLLRSIGYAVHQAIDDFLEDLGILKKVDLRAGREKSVPGQHLAQGQHEDALDPPA